MSRKYLFFILILFSSNSWAQENVKIFTVDDFLWFVKNYHPVSLQGKLLQKKGENTILSARGAFDPLLYSDLDQKSFDDKKYYNILSGGLKIPSWYGLEFNTGIDQSSGSFLNPENIVPPGGLWYAGISVSLAQGLIIDNRRASLKRAQIYAQSTKAEQQLLMNELYFDAISEYWKWMEAWNQFEVYNQSLTLSQSVLDAVKQSFMLGDRPAIDTLEAFIQVQNRQINLNQARLDYQNTSLGLSNYLWFENNTPMEITDTLKPPLYEEIQFSEIITLDSIGLVLNQLFENHPELQAYRYKLASMEVERRLKTDNLKPKINLNYNILNEQIGNNIFTSLSVQNYKWGINFSFPLLLRQQRGDLQITKLKIRDTELEQQQKLLELQNRVKKYHNEQLNLSVQVALFSDAVNNYSKMLDGERKKFDMGESSLFLVNSRETGLVLAKLKLIELVAKYHTSVAGMKYASGILHPIE